MTDPSKARKIIDQDTELVEAIQAGQHDLFPDLVQRYEGALYNFGMKMCGDASDAEDVVQETFINVFRYINGFRYETKFKNWLYRIVTSSCVKKRRKSKFAPERELSLDEFMPEEGAAAGHRTPSWATLPLDQVLHRELASVMQQAILDLQEKYRVVLVLRDIEGFSTQESAQILDLTTANVKVRLHRARLFLRDKLKAYFDDA